VRLTQPVVAPLRRVIPGFGGLDLATLLFALVLIGLKEAVLGRMYFGVWLDAMGLLQRSAFGLIFAVLQLMLMLVFARAILSWVDPRGHSPFYHVLSQLTEPLLRPIRRVIPAIGGLDLSPMLAILLIFLAQWVVGVLMASFH
jgi:YggT family protein